MKKQYNPNCPGIPNRKYYYQRTPKILLDQEIHALLEVARSHSFRDYTLILFALNTGLRNSEVIGLNVVDVCPFDIVIKTLELPALIAKGNKPRSIYLNDITISALSLYLQEEFSTKRITDGITPLFRSKWSNKRLGTRDFQQILGRHSIEAINRHCHPHMLRHTFATKLIGQANIKIVQEILGHSNIQNTQVYLHPSSSEKLDAVNKLNFTSRSEELHHGKSTPR
ncbi:Tyrosine recombinase XerD [subsurface metagenome]